MILEVILILSLIILFYQDLKFREVYWLLFPIIFLSGLASTIQSDLILEFPYHIFFNIGLVSLILLLMLIYFRLFARKSTKELLSMIGLGDVFFFFSITPFFDSIIFILFFSVSLLLILTVSSFFIFRKKSFPIPLAGLQSFLLLTVLVLRKSGIPILEHIQNLLL